MADRDFRNIALVGFMGAGKSTVGQLLAELLNFDLVDTDRVIEAREGCRVEKIFERQGEAAFRALESAMVAELADAKRTVIATGGGLVVNPENFASLRRHSFLACLWASPETIFERVRRQTHRPLLQGPNPQAKVRELLGARAPIYQQSDLLVGVDFRSPAETARHIAQAFHQASPQA